MASPTSSFSLKLLSGFPPGGPHGGKKLVPQPSNVLHHPSLGHTGPAAQEVAEPQAWDGYSPSPQILAF